MLENAAGRAHENDKNKMSKGKIEKKTKTKFTY